MKKKFFLTTEDFKKMKDVQLSNKHIESIIGGEGIQPVYMKFASYASTVTGGRG